MLRIFRQLNLIDTSANKASKSSVKLVPVSQPIAADCAQHGYIMIACYDVV